MNPVVADERAMVLCFFAGLFVLLLPPVVSATPTISIPRVASPPIIDGRLDDTAWRDAALVTELFQSEPVEGAEPTQRTEIRIARDADNLYFGVRCHDTSADRIVARKMLRDTDVETEDRFSIAIDTFHDRRNGYLFQVTALATRRDALIEGAAVNFDWDGLWHAEAVVDGGGWSVEIVLPFKSLSFDPQSDAWGLNLLRAIGRSNELSRWAAARQNVSFTNMAEAGVMTGMRGLHQGLGLDLVPGVALRHVDDPLDGTHRTDFEPTLDVFYKIAPSLTGVVTFNTDFGETEVDERQVNLTRFSLFFPEKRDFFLQDAGIFEFGSLSANGRPFFSRRIGLAPDGQVVDIIAGAKVTGRVGRFSIGLVDVQTDDVTLARDLPGEREIDGRNLGVVRVSANVLDESSVGAIVTWGDAASNDDNTLVGVDWNYATSHFRDGEVLRARLWGQYADVEQRDVGSQDRSAAFGGQLQYPNDRINWDLVALEIQEGFRPGIGFVNRVGIRDYAGQFRYRSRFDGRLRTIDQLVTTRLVTDTSNDVETGQLVLTLLDVASDVGDGIELSYEHHHEVLEDPFPLFGVEIPAGGYDFDLGRVVVQASETREWAGTLAASWGDFYSGSRLELQPTISWRPSRHWLVQGQYIYNDVDLAGGSATSHLIRGRLNLQISPDTSWNTLVQYDNGSDVIGVNSRFRWIVEPGREVFLGFNQGVELEQGNLSRGRTEPIAKVKWTFRY